MPKAAANTKRPAKSAPKKQTLDVSFGPSDSQFVGTISGYILDVSDIEIEGKVRGKRIKLRPLSQGWHSPAREGYEASTGARKSWPIVEVWGQGAKLLDPNIGKGDWLQASNIFPTVSSWIGKDSDGKDAAFAALVFRTEHPPLVILAPSEEEEETVPPPEDDANHLEDIPG